MMTIYKGHLGAWRPLLLSCQKSNIYCGRLFLQSWPHLMPVLYSSTSLPCSGELKALSPLSPALDHYISEWWADGTSNLTGNFLGNNLQLRLKCSYTVTVTQNRAFPRLFIEVLGNTTDTTAGIRPENTYINTKLKYCYVWNVAKV